MKSQANVPNNANMNSPGFGNEYDNPYQVNMMQPMPLYGQGMPGLTPEQL
jgi:hypothetical protein